MRKSICQVFGVVALIGVLFAFGGTTDVSAQINVNINIGPPPIVVAEPPAVVMVPGSLVYFVPLTDIDIFFYNGYWWSPRGNQWYRAKVYKGPWKVVNKLYVPAPVFRVPKDYRKVYEKEQHIPYGQWKKQGKEHKEWKEDKKEHKNDRGRGHEDN